MSSNPVYPDEPTYPNAQPPVPPGNQGPAYPQYNSHPNPSYPPQAGNYPPPPIYQPADNVVRSSDFGGGHAESRYSSFMDEQGNVIERRQQVYHDANQERANLRYWATTLIYFLLGLLEVVLGLRWLFRLLGANASNNFVNFLYDVSHPFVAPFNGIFNDQTLGHQGVFEFSTLIAMLVYALIAWGVVALLNLLLRPVPPSTDTTTTTRRRQL